MKTKKLVYLTLMGIGIFIFNSCSTIPKNAQAVKPFDKEKYLGKWFEIARLDFKFEKKDEKSNEWFDRLVYTDTHIGMDVNGKAGDTMYESKWDKEELNTRLKKMIEHVLKYQKSDTLVIDDLGDFLDGMGGQTTRRGHELPQNMNDREVFDLG